MTEGKRQKLFYALTAAFLLLGTGIVFYAQGWRLDMASLKLRKVGAIFVRSYPADAKIYLNGKTIKNDSGIFQNGTLINDLFPKTYELKLTAKDYHPWQENFSVLPSMVAEVKYAVLAPQKISQVATGTIKNFWILDEDVLLQNQKNELFFGNAAIGSGEMLGFTNDFNDVLIFDAETGSYLLHDFDSGKNLNVNKTLKKIGYDPKKISGIFIDPDGRGKLILREAKKIFGYDPEKNVLSKLEDAKIDEETGNAAAGSKFYLFWTKFNRATNSSTVIVYDKFLQDSREKSFELSGKNVSLAWLKNNKLAVLQDNGFLYLYDIAENIPKKIAEGVKSFAYADDGAKIAAVENNALEIFSLSGDANYHRFNLPEINSVKNVFWYSDMNHLFVQYTAHVAFLDLADVALRNFVTIAQTSFSRYDTKMNLFYFINEGKLFTIEFPN